MRRVVAIAVGVLLLCTAIAVAYTIFWDQDRRIARGNDFDVGTCRRLAGSYFSKPQQQTIDDFTLNGLSKQYEIYICGSQFMEPPQMGLAMRFASEGARAATFLKHRLAGRNDDLTTRDIVYVFVWMKRLHTYDVTGDAQLMLLLNQKAQAISDAFWREYVAKEVTALERS